MLALLTAVLQPGSRGQERRRGGWGGGAEERRRGGEGQVSMQPIWVGQGDQQHPGRAAAPVSVLGRERERERERKRDKGERDMRRRER